MFIQTEETPNPLTLKFSPGVPVMPSGTLFLTSAEDAKNSPLALELFRVEGVTAVFLGADFITITRSPAAGWDTLKPALLTAIMDHFVAGKPVVTETASSNESSGDESEAHITERHNYYKPSNVRTNWWIVDIGTLKACLPPIESVIHRFKRPRGTSDQVLHNSSLLPGHSQTRRPGALVVMIVC